MRDARQAPMAPDDSVVMAMAVSVWWVAAMVAGASGVLTAARPPVLQVAAALLVVVLLVLSRVSPLFRRWAWHVDLRGLVLIHASRLVGLYLLFVHAQGRLPYDFAVRGGWGDIVIAVAAVALVLLVAPRCAGGRALYALWNLLGLLDILFVVATAARLGLADPFSMRELTFLPLSLLPTFLVPVMVFTHVLIFLRLFAGGEGSARAA